ncbi:MAG: DHA1 family bicyclomycin/chloramphenicol resistance-like MFS transporter [Halioglobus sp.]|jgi:DHA1 family bicyclomycin/chloramphenicol resistance-like MFS transporter
MTKHTLDPDSPWLLAILASLVALGPLSIDMYLPALPTMQVALNTTVSQMHLTLSAYLIGFAVFHLACGPLADRYGRKPVLICGTTLFVLASIGCSQADTIKELLLFRVLQGVGACVGPTLARAIVRDIFGPTRAARALSILAMLMAVAPALAPTLGGTMLLFLPWSSIFIFLSLYGLASIFLVQRYVRESLPQKQSLHPIEIAKNYAQLIRDPFYLLVTLSSALMYAGLLTYLSSSSFVYIKMLGVPVQYFGYIFLTGVVGYALGSGLSARLAGRRTPEQLSLLGTTMGLAACLIMWLSSFLYPDKVATYMLPMALFSAALGLTLPNSMAIALRPFPHIAGTASSLLGFIQMSIAAIASALAGLLLTTSPQPMVLTMVGTAILSLILNFIMYKRHQNSAG